MKAKILQAAGLLVCVAPIGVAQTITGQWTIGGVTDRGQVQLTLERHSAGSDMTNSSPLPLADLHGLTQAQLESAGTMARFDLVRDAGALHFEGYLQSGGGGGAFQFAPDAKFAQAMRSFGLPDLSADEIFRMAIHDVSTAFVRDLSVQGIHAESSGQLIALRIHGVTPEYVREFRALGYSGLTADKLVTLRIHGATPDFARELNSLGYASVSPDELVKLRIHGITPEYIRNAKSKIAGNLTIDQLIRLKIHGILD